MSDTFGKDYAKLENRFRVQVEEDRKLLRCNDIVFLSQSMMPIHQVDYVFIGMEPSLRRWARTQQEAEEKIERGFKDFAFSIEDFILHHCIREYLYCNQDSTYYITNLSKGAMRVAKANEDRVKRWERWLRLLREELELVEKDTTRLIAIGRNVKDFLESNGFSDIHMILHYSQQAAGYRDKWIEWDQNAFEKFKRQVSNKDIIATAKSVTQQAKMDWTLTSASLRELETRDLTDSQKMLAFGYKCYFTRHLLGLGNESP
ncbi:MAG: hypothetical protein ABSF21_04165 [Dehalococcoidia bacterium]